MKPLVLIFAIPAVAVASFFGGRRASGPVVDIGLSAANRSASSLPQWASSGAHLQGVSRNEAPFSEAQVFESIAHALVAPSAAEASMRIDRAVRAMDSGSLQRLFDRYDRFSSNEQLRVLPIAISRWVELDEPAATAWMVRAAVTFRKNSTTFDETMRRYTESSSAAAERLLGLLESSEGKAVLYRLTLEKRAMRDVVGAMAVMESLPEGSVERDEAARGILQTCAIYHPERVFSDFAKAEYRKNPRLRSEVISRMAAGYAKNGFGNMDEILGKLDSAQERAALLNGTVYGIGVASLERIGEYYFRQLKVEPELATYFLHYDIILERIAKKNGIEALRLCATIPVANRKASQLAAIHHWASAQPEIAMKWAEGQTEPREQQAATRTVFGGWAANATESAVAWLEKQPDSKLKTELAEVAVRELAKQGSHDKALDWIEKLAPPEQRMLASDVANLLAQSDPKTAARWLARIEPDDDIAHTFGHVAECWAEKDYQGAAKWVATLPAGIIKDSAVGRFAAAVAAHDPVVAAEWAMTVQDADLRTRAVSAVYFDWAKRDRVSAIRWAKSVGLADDKIKKLTR